MVKQLVIELHPLFALLRCGFFRVLVFYFCELLSDRAKLGHLRRVRRKGERGDYLIFIGFAFLEEYPRSSEQLSVFVRHILRLRPELRAPGANVAFAGYLDGSIRTQIGYVVALHPPSTARL